ncbi:hypothetical protein N7462_005543 [Penicillium macrosclerotiorum]|uniref:uncharacterized protein n=1 Tax=Penicillium macrosclerotiorum TaxID=303699 RepID=UPI00254825BD|nr:uncharacterized protein N7462_005543 [Penicillium macrosclerotiorum]KAJ5682378.1 hypothetical protein N7462_005543 [Penicillium macrosclerotiorum]
MISGYTFNDRDIRLGSASSYSTYVFFSFGLAVLWIASTVCYRLFLSPLARFPGPRLAAASRLYELYFQLLKGGIFTWHIDKLHAKYGPIVRVSPWELHIKDPDYYNTVYAGPGKHRNKDPWFSFIAYPESIFSTAGHELHRPRRKILSHFFKKNVVTELESMIHESLRLLCRHFSTAAETNQPLELHAAFYSFTCDNLSQYAFGRENGFHYLEENQITDTWKTRMTSLFEFCRINRHIPPLSYMARLAPSIVSWFVPRFRYVDQMEHDVKQKVKTVLNQHLNDKRTPQSPGAIYPSILADPDVPPSEKRLRRLEDDAIFLLMAGTDAPSQALAITMFYILDNHKVYQTLRSELSSELKNIAITPTLKQLEQVQYLSAVVREGLRLSAIVTTRLPRSAPDETLQYQQWQIPAGTFVSMSTYFILKDPKIFPNPEAFMPERWLLPTDQLRELEKHLVPASKGTLGCLGQNLAWAWMHLVLGTLLRRFDMALHETTRKNVEMTRDNFIGQTDVNMNNVNVKVLEEYSD